MAELSIVHTLIIHTEECCVCGVVVGLTRELYKQRRDDHKPFYCPNGHSQSYLGKTEAEKLREDLEAQKRRTEMALADARHETQQRKTAQTKLKKMKERITNGVCPCCNRHFTNVERHMATKHPDFKLDGGEGEGG